MVTRFYLVRHAEAEGNAKEFFQGSTETLLTEKGKQQLQYLSERFRTIPLDAVISSPFGRARQTAEAINLHHKLPILTEYDLREINGGDWEGRPWTELPVAFPEAYADWTDALWRFQAPNGEPMGQVWNRMTAVMERLARDHKGQTVAVASHGCALRNFLCFVEFCDMERLADVGWADNTAVSLVEYDDESGWRLIFKNDASHLPKECSTLRRSHWCRYETAKEENT